MTIAKLQQFQAVCQFQSVTKAAEHLHISQPSVSATIRELEQEFNLNLFRHEGRHLVLTAEGQFLLDKANALLGNFEQLSLQMHDLGKNKNCFRIGVPPMSGTIFFPGLYKAYCTQHPEMQLSITECGSLQAAKLLEQGELDIAMATINTPLPPQFHSLPLCCCQMMLCVSPKHRLAGMQAIDITLLEHEPLVLFQEDSAPSQTIRQMFSSQGLQMHILLHSSQLSMIKQFIADGTAAAFLLEPLVEHDSDIIAIPFQPPLFFDTVLMWRRDQHLYSDVASLIDFAKTYDFSTHSE